MRVILLMSFLSLGGLPLSGEDILPTEFPVTRYTSLWEDSPFNREVVSQVETRIQSTFGINLTLEGLVTDETAGAIAYMRDLQENKFLVVTKEKKEGVPFYLVSASKSNNPAETRVTITDGKETAEIGFTEGVFTKKIDTPIPAQPKADSNAQAPKPATPAGNGDAATPPVPATTPEATNAGQPPAESDSRRRRILLPSRSPETSN